MVSVEKRSSQDAFLVHVSKVGHRLRPLLHLLLLDLLFRTFIGGGACLSHPVFNAATLSHVSEQEEPLGPRNMMIGRRLLTLTISRLASIFFFFLDKLPWVLGFIISSFLQSTKEPTVILVTVSELWSQASGF